MSPEQSEGRARVPGTDRASFVARLRGRAGEPAPENAVHRLRGPLDAVPLVRSSMLDETDLVGSFVRNATSVGARVHVATGAGDLPAIVADVVEHHGIRRAVASKQRDAWAFVELLGANGVEVAPFDPASSAAADLGVTVASAAIATTGTIVQRSDDVGGRTASLLPRVHLAVVPASCVVGTSADVLRRLPETGLPSNLVLVTGPSKSGDIEQIIVIGVHGPVALELCVVLDI